MKPVVVRPPAQRDLDSIVDHYRAEAGERVAEAWALAVADALRHIGAFPGTGSLRYASDLSIEGLRFWQPQRFPYLVFYLELSDCIDVLRILHGSRDIPVSLREADSEAGANE